MEKVFTVAVSIKIASSAQRQIVRGIIRFCQMAADWRFVEHQGIPLVLSPQLAELDYDGLITTLNTATELKNVQAGESPVVAVCQGLRAPNISIVRSNDALIGEMGARYFLDKGFRNFAFYGARGYQSIVSGMEIPATGILVES